VIFYHQDKITFITYTVGVEAIFAIWIIWLPRHELVQYLNRGKQSAIAISMDDATMDVLRALFLWRP